MVSNDNYTFRNRLMLTLARKCSNTLKTAPTPHTRSAVWGAVWGSANALKHKAKLTLNPTPQTDID